MCKLKRSLNILMNFLARKLYCPYCNLKIFFWVPPYCIFSVGLWYIGFEWLRKHSLSQRYNYDMSYLYDKALNVYLYKDFFSHLFYYSRASIVNISVHIDQFLRIKKSLYNVLLNNSPLSNSDNLEKRRIIYSLFHKKIPRMK